MPYYKVNTEVTNFTLPSGKSVSGDQVIFLTPADWTALDGQQRLFRQVNADGSPLVPYVPPTNPSGGSGTSAFTVVGTKTSAYAANANEVVPVDISGGSFAVTLPSASTKWQLAIKVMNATSATSPTTSLAITPNGSDTLNGVAGTVPLRYKNQSKLLVSDGTNNVVIVSGDSDLTVNEARVDAKIATQAGVSSQTFAPYAVFGSSRPSAAMVEEIPAPAAYPTIVDLGTTTTSYSGTPNAYPAVVTGAPNPLFRYNVGSPGVSGASVVPFAQPIGTNNRAIAFDQPLSIAFDTDGTSFELTHTRNTTADSFRVWVNEQLSATVPLPSSAGSTRYKVNVGLTREMRRIVIEFDGYAVFTAITVASTDTVLSPQDGATRRLAMVGDSYLWGQGYRAIAGTSRSYGTTTARRLGFGHYRHFSAGATGFVAAGAYSAYQQRLADVISYAPDVVVLQGSINDNGQSNVQAAATLAIQTLQNALPNAKIFLTGVLRSYSTSGADTTTNTALQAAATATGVPFIGTTNWCVGTGSVTSPNGSGNSDVYNFSFSADHPSAAGHQYLGRRMAWALADTVGQALDVRPQPLAEAVRSAIAAIPAGAPGLVWRGAYNNATTYATNDGTSYLGRSWIALQGTTGVTPPSTSTPTATWGLLADKGDFAVGATMTSLAAGGEVAADRDKVNSNGVILTSGSIIFSGARIATKTETIVSATIGTGGTAAAGNTFAGYAVYEVADDNSLTLVASTASSSTLWASTFQPSTPSGTVNTKLAFTSSFTKTAGKRYTVGLLFVGTTAPTVYGISTVAPDASTALVAPFQGAVLASQTSFPASIAGSSLTGKQSLVPAPLLLIT